MKIDIEPDEVYGFQIISVLITLLLVACVLIHGCQKDPEANAAVKAAMSPESKPVLVEKP